LDVLERAGNPGRGNRALRGTRDVFPGEPDAPAARAKRTCDQIEHCALAGAVWTDEPENFTRAHLEADIVHRDQAAEAALGGFDLHQHVAALRLYAAGKGI